MLICTTWNSVRRNRDARVMCIEKKGSTCSVCGFNSAEAYGVEGIVHAHHLRPMYELAAGEMARVDPIADLVPVCPNCHALIHSKGPRECYTIDEARAMFAGRDARCGAPAVGGPAASAAMPADGFTEDAATA